MLIRSTILFSALLLAGCADNGAGSAGFLSGGNKMTTSAVATTPAVDPACSGLAAQISQLRQDGIGDKIEKASLKKYKMTAADLAKADQLTKADADFQTKCSTLPRSASIAPAPTGVGAAAVSAAKSAAASAVTKSASAAATGAAGVAKSAVKTVATGDAAAAVAAGGAVPAATAAAADASATAAQ